MAIHMPDMNKSILRMTFFIGWMLSPFTAWNDAFINIPIAYLCASLTIKFMRFDFTGLTILFYWLSNGIGLVMMYISGKNLIESGGGALKEALKLLITLVIYSLLLLLLGRIGILKPVHFLWLK